MQDSQFFWSEKARRDFAVLFEDANYSERFRSAVAEALTRGWSRNRDKPIWALAYLVAAIGEGKKISGQINPGQVSNGLDLVWAPREQIWQTLCHLADSGREFPAGAVLHEESGLLMEAPDGRWKLSKMRLEVLRKLSEFLLGCDDFSFAPSIMAYFSELETGGLDDHELIKSHARAISRLAYKYRSENFKDGHASSAFSTLKSFMVGRESMIVDDETVFDFWVWPENVKYKTYQAVYFAFVDFYETIKEATAASAFSSATEIDDPAIAAEIATAFTDPTAEQDAQLCLLGLELYSDSNTAVEAPDEGGAVANPTDVFKQSQVKLFKRNELAFLSQLHDIGEFGLSCCLASLRLMGFHQVQSGISNSLRTGRTKLPLERRVECEEAVAYDQCYRDLGDLAEKARSWLKVAYSLRADNENNEVVHQIREEGANILKKSRAKSLAKERDELKRELEATEEALISCQRVSLSFAERVATRFGKPPEPALNEQFVVDRDRFAAVFRDRYLGESAKS